MSWLPARVFGCIALLSFGENGWAGSMDPIAHGLLRQMTHRARHAKPGDWISYRTDGGGGRVSFWRLSAVGAEKDTLGRDALWIEVELGQHQDLHAPLLQMKMLVARAHGLAAEGVTRLFVAIGADPPQEIPPDRLRSIWSSPFSTPRLSNQRSADEGARAGDVALRADGEFGSGEEIIRVGQEARLMTRAGTVPAVPVEIYHRGSLIEQIWMSHRLPLLGLAKLEMPATGHAMEVTGFGTDATPRMIAPQSSIRLDAAGGPTDADDASGRTP